MPDSVTQILASGPPGTKKNIAVLGDGFAAADQTHTTTRSRNCCIDGVFGHDYFYEDAQAFNIYRVNLISSQSAVSPRTYDEHGTPTDRSDDTIVSDDDQGHRARLHLQRLVGALLARGRRRHRDAGCRTRSTRGCPTTTSS